MAIFTQTVTPDCRNGCASLGVIGLRIPLHSECSAPPSSSVMAARNSSRKSLPSLGRLLRRGHFSTIIDLLEDQSVNLERWFEQEYTLLGENCLHFIMRFGPPARLVLAMINRLKALGVSQPELSVDLNGLSALHHACAWACEPSVIHVLLGSPGGVISARAQDRKGRLPLHHAALPREFKSGFRRLKRLYSEATIEQVLSRTYLNIKLLLGISPRTSCVADDKGRLPLDYLERLGFIYQPVGETVVKAIRMELNVTKDLCMTTSSYQAEKSGMVIKFPTEVTEDDDVSVLSISDI